MLGRTSNLYNQLGQFYMKSIKPTYYPHHRETIKDVKQTHTHTHLRQSCLFWEYPFYYNPNFLTFNTSISFITSSKLLFLAMSFTVDKIAKSESLAWPIVDPR